MNDICYFGYFAGENTLNFYHKYNEVLNDEIIDFITKNNCKKLRFGSDFNSKIDNLPPCVKHIVFLGIFNQPIDFLPSLLVSISIYSRFNQTINNLPNNLEKLTICYPNYDKILVDLPSGLKQISMPEKYPHFNKINIPNRCNLLKI